MTKRKMYKEMRKILRYVESGGDPNYKTSQESDLWGECLKRGFLNVSADSFRDESGIWHIDLINHNITPSGIEWLYAPNADRKSTIAILVSIAALIVSVLSNLQSIFVGISLLWELIGF